MVDNWGDFPTILQDAKSRTFSHKGHDLYTYVCARVKGPQLDGIKAQGKLKGAPSSSLSRHFLTFSTKFLKISPNWNFQHMNHQRKVNDVNNETT